MLTMLSALLHTHPLLLIKDIPTPTDTSKHTERAHHQTLMKEYTMASHRAEICLSPDVVPFFLNSAEYVGFFLNINPDKNNFSTFILERKDFNSQSEFMENLAIIYDSLSR